MVTWFNPGGSTLVDYRLTALSQDLQAGQQTEVGFTVAASDSCGFMSATVSNLTPGTHYVFSVDGVYRRSGTEGTYTRTIARSRVVSTM